MTLHGRLHDIVGGRLHFAGDLEANLDHADSVYNGINAMIDEYIAANDIDVAEGPSKYQAVWRPYGYRGSRLPAAGLAAVVWATGFTRDYRWLHVPVFDGAGHPQHVRGVTPVPGVYFVGLPWLHTWGSGRFAGVARDAEHVVHAVLAGRTAPLRAAIATP